MPVLAGRKARHGIGGGRGEEIEVTLADLAREGARRMIAAALEAEVEEHVGALVDEFDEDGHGLVVRNGRARERRLTVGSGTVGDPCAARQRHARRRRDR